MDYLLHLIDETTSHYDDKDNEYMQNDVNLTNIKNVIKLADSDPLYKYEFITLLGDDFLSLMVDQVQEESERESFLASLLYLKKLMKINKEMADKITLNDNQQKEILKLLEIMKQYVNEKEYSNSEQRSLNGVYKKNILKLKRKLEEKEVLNKTDYESVGYLLSKESDDKYSELMSAVNRYNLILLQGNNVSISQVNDVEQNDDDINHNDKLLSKFDVNIKEFKKEYPVFFLESYQVNNRKMDLLEDNGIDINEVLKHAPKLLLSPYYLLEKNMTIMKSYGFDLSCEEDKSNYVVLGTGNLDLALDYFIELGYNDFIHKDVKNCLKNLRALIIKRIYYAYKNKINIWRIDGTNVEMLSNREKNKDYDKLIREQATALDEETIDVLISKYPILEGIDASHRAYIFKDSYNAAIKRKTELIFGNKIISRIKTYSLFKVLVDNNVNVQEALLYALSYNTILDQSEYDNLKSVVYFKEAR